MDVSGRGAHDPATIDDPPSADEEDPGRAPNALDLTPRTLPAARRAAAPRRRWPAVAVLVAILAAIGFVASRAITDATVFFHTADEAVAKQQELGDRRFRLEGFVVPGSTSRRATGATFSVANNGVTVAVDHTGDPPDLFQDCIPVVVEGRWATTSPGAPFVSDRILVKHDETYDADNPDRLTRARDGALQGCARDASVPVGPAAAPPPGAGSTGATGAR